MSTSAASTATPSSGQSRVEAALNALGLPVEVLSFTQSTRTSAQAAEAIGCELAQIAKSIVFRATVSDTAVVVIASGIHRVDSQRLSDLIGEPVGRADADFVRARTGFVIGGVAPLAHTGEVSVWIDDALLEIDPIFAAAGSPHAVFKLSAQDLSKLPNAKIAHLRED